MRTLHATKKRELICLEMLCSIHEIWKIEVCNIVPNDKIWVNLFNKVSPGLQHLSLVVKRHHLWADDVWTCIQGENIANERLGLALKSRVSEYIENFRSHTLPRHHVSNLDDWINLCLGEYALPASTLNIEAQYTKRCKLLPVFFRWVRDEGIPPSAKHHQTSMHTTKRSENYLTLSSIWHVDFLSFSDTSLYWPAGISIQFMPTTCRSVISEFLWHVFPYLGIDHETQGVRNVTLECWTRLSGGEKISKPAFAPLKQAYWSKNNKYMQKALAQDETKKLISNFRKIPRFGYCKFHEKNPVISTITPKAAPLDNLYLPHEVALSLFLWASSATIHLVRNHDAYV